MFPKAGENGRKIGFLHVMSLMSRLRQKVLCKEVKTITEDAGVTMSRNETGEFSKTKNNKKSFAFISSFTCKPRKREREIDTSVQAWNFFCVARNNQHR